MDNNYQNSNGIALNSGSCLIQRLFKKQYIFLNFFLSFFCANTALAACAADGTIDNTVGGVALGQGTCATASNNTATVISGATLTNASGSGIVGDGIKPWTITNNGTINVTGGQGIYSPGNNAPAVTLVNNGIISSSNLTGVMLTGGGTVVNNAGGIIEGAFIGLELSGPNGPNPSGGPSSVDNAGIIRSTSGYNNGILFGKGGNLLNRASGLVDGFAAVEFSALGSVNNYGQIGTLTNSSTAIGLGAGGTVTNQQGANIFAQSRGVSVDGAAGTINNYGAITTPSGRTISMSAGGAVNNYAGGTMTAGTRAVYIDGGAGILNNAGIITGNTLGIGYPTVELHGANSTVINTGTINGDIQFFAANGTVVLYGGVVNGKITFYGSANTFLINGGKINGTVDMGTGGNENLILQNITNESVEGSNLLSGGSGNNNSLTFLSSSYIGGSKIVNWETINVHDNTSLTLTSDLVLGNASSTVARVLNINAATIKAQNALNTTIKSANSTALTVNNAGTIDISSVTTNNALSIVGNYVGQGGVLQLNIDTVKQTADKLVLDGSNGGSSATGKTFLTLHNIGTTWNATTGDGILLVEAVNNATTDPSAFALSVPIRVGLYDYRLFRGGSSQSLSTPSSLSPSSVQQNWYLRSVAYNSQPIIGPELSVYGSVMPAIMNVGRVTTGTLHERSGDNDVAELLQEKRKSLDMAPNSSNNAVSTINTVNGTWMRLLDQNYHQRYANIANPYVSENIAGLQVGVDVYRQRTAEGGLNLAGFYAAYAHTNSNIDGLVTHDDGTVYTNQHTGSINLNSVVGGLYWTHFWRQGAYLDLVAEGSTYQGSASSTRTSVALSGKGVDGSVEFGYPIHFVKQWTLEPQAQLIYQYVNIDDAADMFSMVNFASSTALVGRAGMRIKFDTSVRNHWLQPYVRVNYWSILAGGNNSAKFDGDTLTTSTKNTWLQFGGGITMMVTKKYSLFLYVDDVVGLRSGQHSLHGIDAGIGLRARW
jgi:outer membrane autotransporter protein